VEVVRIVDVADTRNYVPVFLVNLEHLLDCLLRHVAEERHLQRNLVDEAKVFLDLFNTARQHFVPVQVDPLGQLRRVV
jgi:hypothetical protein